MPKRKIYWDDHKLQIRQKTQLSQSYPDWENWFTCTTWLPVIFQNPAQIPPFWQELRDLTTG
ncbi:MAG: hypothetical protein KME49_04290 [Brasilonema octagenarum HA4186-MV1]|nr:hypothetical protein [Brasilonema octagenarum HA4186-MV1]